MDYFLVSDTLSDVETLEIAIEETVKKIGRTVEWGATGVVVSGPVGLLAGLLLGGKKNQVTFVVKFKDGKKSLHQPIIKHLPSYKQQHFK